MNVLYVGTDDQTPDSIPAMPWLSSQTDWITFTQAHAQDATCCTARAQWFTGQSALHNGVTDNATGGKLNNTQTLAVWMKQAGYRTGLFGKYLNGYGTGFARAYRAPPGWDTFRATIGTDQYTQYNYRLTNGDGTLTRFGAAPADYKVDVTGRLLREFIAASAGTPWFAVWTPTSTHSPWKASPTTTGMFATAPLLRAPNNPEVDRADKPAWVRAAPPVDPVLQDDNRRKQWAGAVSIDDELRRIDAELTATGQRDNTVVVYVGDNGYAFGEHGWTTKLCEYNECSQVPLMVRYPGQPARKVTVPVSSVDIPTTVMDLSGSGALPAIPQDGRSFASMVTDPAPPATREILLHWSGGDGYGRVGTAGSLPSYWGIRTQRWKYVELGTGEKELYDELKDPYELHNLAGTPVNASLQAGLATRLNRMRAAAGGATAPDRADSPNGRAQPALDTDGVVE